MGEPRPGEAKCAVGAGAGRPPEPGRGRLRCAGRRRARGPAPWRPGLAAAGGLARSLATGRVTLARSGHAPAGWSGRWGQRSATLPGQPPPWEPPQRSSNDQYPFPGEHGPSEEGQLHPAARRQAAVISLPVPVIRPLTHPEKHSPLSCPCGGVLAPHRHVSLSPHQGLPLPSALGRTQEMAQVPRDGSGGVSEQSIRGRGRQRGGWRRDTAAAGAVRMRAAGRNEFRSGPGLAPKNSPGVGIRARRSRRVPG